MPTMHDSTLIQFRVYTDLPVQNFTELRVLENSACTFADNSSNNKDGRPKNIHCVARPIQKCPDGLIIVLTVAS